MFFLFFCDFVIFKIFFGFKCFLFFLVSDEITGVSSPFSVLSVTTGVPVGGGWGNPRV